jgi:hypothetical protein
MNFLWAMIMAIGFVLPDAASAETRADVGLSIQNGAVRSFHLAIGEFFHVPEREVIHVHKRRIPDPEIPVVFHIAHHARVHPDKVIAHRLRGHSWMEVTLHFGLSPDIYSIPAYPGPYGKHGYDPGGPRRHGRIHLDDRYIIDSVNIFFISNRYRYEPDIVIRHRSQGRDYLGIHDDIRRHHRDREARNDRSDRHGRDRDDRWDRGHRDPGDQKDRWTEDRKRHFKGDRGKPSHRGRD